MQNDEVSLGISHALLFCRIGGYFKPLRAKGTTANPHQAEAVIPAF
jgi:hypothetical protein